MILFWAKRGPSSSPRRPPAWLNPHSPAWGWILSSLSTRCRLSPSCGGLRGRESRGVTWLRLRYRRPWLVLPPGDPGSRAPAGSSGWPRLLYCPRNMIHREGRKHNAHFGSGLICVIILCGIMAEKGDSATPRIPTFGLGKRPPTPCPFGARPGLYRRAGWGLRPNRSAGVSARCIPL